MGWSIINTEIALIAKVDKKIKITSDADIKKYSIGVIIDDVGEQLAKGKGATKLDASSTKEANLKKLNAGRIDLFAYEKNVAFYSIKEMGMSPADFESVYILKSGELYFAFNPNTPDNVLADFKKAIQKLKDSGEYQKIVDKYFK